MKKILSALQKLGKALMLPIAALPVAGLLLRFGQSDLTNLKILADAGGALFDNLPLLFAIGVAVGLAKDNNGAAGLAGAISFFIMKAALQAVGVALTFGHMYNIDGLGDMVYNGEIALLDMMHLGGILSGVIAGLCYNKFHKIKLPDWLGFFGGRRFVPIVSGGVSLIAGAGFGLIWPSIQKALDVAANWMVTSGGIGALIYGFLNRVLIAFGLHHVINSVVWFQFGTWVSPEGIEYHGDLTRFMQSAGADGGIFTAGFFPIMMFAIPAAAFAMYVCAKKENKPAVGGALFSVGFTAFLTGITEPIEFMFMFLAPGLFVIHGILTGVSLMVCQMLGIRDSFTFSAGAMDYILNWNIAERGWMIIPVGIVFALVYFFLFVFFIKKFDLKTPGREDDEEMVSEEKTVSSNSNMSSLAQEYVKLLGGKENIKEIEACITRMRLVLESNKDLNEAKLKALGASGVMKAGNQVTQVIVGTKAELIVDEMKKVLSSQK